MIVNKARRWLIQLGKTLPFIVCAIVCISFIENLTAAALGRYAEMYDGSITLYTPMTWYIAQIGLVYDVRLLALLLVISVAIETCIYNKLCVLFLGFNLIEKHYLSQIESYTEMICIIAILNILASAWLTYKGIKIYIYSRKV